MPVRKGNSLDGEVRSALVKELQRRAPKGTKDIQLLKKEFQEPGAGGRILASEGDGRVSVYVPVRDGFEGIEHLDVAPHSNHTASLAHVAVETVAIPDFGTFKRATLEPLRYKSQLDAKGRPLLALRGTGPDTEWSPLETPGEWFTEDYHLLADLANRGGVEVRPDVEVDPADPHWVRLSPEQREHVERSAQRRVPGVVHQDDLRHLLAQAQVGEGARAGAIQGLAQLLEPAPLNVPAARKESAAKLAAAQKKAQPVLAGLLGADGVAPQQTSDPLLELAHGALKDLGDRQSLAVIDAARAHRNPPAEEVAHAMDAAFGAGFFQTRVPTLSFIERVLDSRGDKLTLEQATALGSLKEELDIAEGEEMFGVADPTRPIVDEVGEQKLQKLHKFLAQGTGLDEAGIFHVASALHNALNVPSEKPTVLILSGESGSAVDTVFARAVKMAGPHPLEVSGANELRLEDPVGYLVGSPADRPGSARGALVRADQPGERLVVALKDLDAVGEAAGAPAARESSRRSVLRLLTQARRDGSLWGYDPADDAKRRGAKVDLSNAILLVRDGRSAHAIQESLRDAPELWRQVAPHVVDFGKGSAASTIAGLKETLRTHAVENFGLKGVHIDFTANTQAFLTDLYQNGMSAAQLRQMVLEHLGPRLFFAQMGETLGPSVQVDISRRLTPQQLKRVREGLIANEPVQIPGVGANPFTLVQGAAAPLEAEEGIDPRVTYVSAERQRTAELEALVAEYQLGASTDAKEKRQLADHAQAADKRINELDWLNQRGEWQRDNLHRENLKAKAAIEELEGQVRTLNGRIDQLNRDLTAVKGAAQKLEGQLRTAVNERDATVRTLRAVEAEANRALQDTVRERNAAVADAVRERNATVGRLQAEANQLIQHTASAGAPSAAALFNRLNSIPGGGGAMTDALREQLFVNATERTLAEAGQMANLNDKATEVAQLARNYAEAAQSLGRPADPGVLNLLRNAADLSGNGWSRDPDGDWLRAAGDQVIASLGFNPAQRPDPRLNFFRAAARRFGVRF
jgi:predicted  nucleic acid-binding Zn-ribbon protein